MLIASGAPASAADRTGAIRIVPPLPLAAETDARGVKENPFCEPVVGPVVDPSIRLASDDRLAPPVRLKPIGVAVGLRNIASPDAGPQPVISITEPAPAAIRHNPLVGSAHHGESNLDEVAVSELNGDGASKRVSYEPELEETAGEEPAMLEEESEPILFSLSDLGDDTTEAPAPVEAPALAMPSRAVPAPPEDTTATNTASPVARQATAPVATKTQAIPKPITLSEDDREGEGSGAVVGLAAPLMPLDFDNAPALPLKNEPKVELSQSKSGSLVPNQRTETSSVVSSKSRFRPPVAVTPPPLAFVRADVAKDVAIVRPAVTRVEAIDLSEDESVDKPASGESGAMMDTTLDASWKIPANAPVIDLYMSKAQVRSLTLGGTIRQVAVDDREVCQAVSAGASSLKLIGTGYGVTRLAVWASPEGSTETKVRVFQVHVDEAVDTTGDSVGNKTDTLNQSIARAFPGCNVQLIQQNGKLIVSGECDSRDSASQIVRMVRKTCLIPVVDELTVR